MHPAQKSDTSREAAAIQSRILGERSGAERLEAAIELCSLARNLTLARLKMQHPEWSEPERTRQLLRYAFGSLPLPPPLR